MLSSGGGGKFGVVGKKNHIIRKRAKPAELDIPNFAPLPKLPSKLNKICPVIKAPEKPAQREIKNFKIER